MAQSIQPSVMYTVSIHHVCLGVSDGQSASASASASAVVLGAMSITGVVFIEQGKSVVTRPINELLYHSIATNVGFVTAIKHVAIDEFCLSAGQCTGASCMEHSPTAGGKTLNFTFLITLFPQQQRGEPH